MSSRWQASATYTLSWLYSAENQPFQGLDIVPFEVAPDLGNEYTLAGDDQRHRAVFNGIWEVGKGFQLSGLHYFGAGIRAANEYGGDLRVLGATGSARLRPNGSLVERNSYVQPFQNKTDIRAQQRVPLGGRAGIDLIAEVFNVFNRPNFIETVQESQRKLRQAGVGSVPHGTARLPSDLLIDTRQVTACRVSDSTARGRERPRVVATFTPLSLTTDRRG